MAIYEPVTGNAGPRRKLRVRSPVTLEPIRLASDSRYGLSGNVWTRDKCKGIELAMPMDTGSVCVNDMSLIYGAAPAPFGGLKQCGVGQVNGPTGLRGYCFAQPILVDRGVARRAGTRTV